MFEIQTDLGSGRVVLALDEAGAPRDAVYAAAFAFIDWCWVHLDRRADGRVEVALRTRAASPPAASDLEALGKDLLDELLGEAWRRKVVDDNRKLLETLATRAFGAADGLAPGLEGSAGEPSLDELLADEGGTFDDPLGIAMSWEEKYAKKDAPKGEGSGSAEGGST